MLLQIRQLAPDHPRHHIAHAVVVAQLLVLVPGSVLPCLGGPLAHPVGGLLAIGQQGAAAGAGDDFIAVEADGRYVAEGAGLSALIGGAQRLRRILNDHRAVAVGNLTQLRHLTGGAVEVGNDHNLHRRVQLKGSFQGRRIHVPGITLGVDKDLLTTLIGNGICSCRKSHVAGKYLIAWLHSRQLHRQMQRRCTGG